MAFGAQGFSWSRLLGPLWGPGALWGAPGGPLQQQRGMKSLTLGALVAVPHRGLLSISGRDSAA